MEYIINNNLIISETEILEQRFEILGISPVNLDAIKNFVNSETNTVFYFNDSLATRQVDDNDTSIAWIDSGYQYNNDTLFISLKKVDDIFSGYYVGTAKYLFNGMCNHHPRKKGEYNKNLNHFFKKYPEKIHKRKHQHLELPLIEEKKSKDCTPTTMQQMLINCGYEVSNISDSLKEENEKFVIEQKELTDVTEEIYNHLLFPSWKSINGLDRYIKIIGHRVQQLVQQKATEYYVINHLGSVIVNSGLINLFGKDYLIHYRINEKFKTYVAHQVINSKQDYLDNGFTKMQSSIELQPIQFFEKGNLLFSPTIDDFDLNQHSLMHIIEERRMRFPINLQHEPANKIASHLSEALERGLKMQRRDHSYAKATYSTKDNAISWMMPLHVNANLTEDPELVMVIRKKNEFYEIKTILPFDDDTKDRITALSLYSKLW